MAGDTFERIVSSDLQRAAQTARLIAGDRPVQIDPRWREFSFGEWEGLPVEGRIAARGYEPPGGETFDAVRVRVEAALGALRRDDPAHALVVTHAGPLHAALHVLLGGVEVRFTPASITRIEWLGERARLLCLNETVAPLG